MSSKVKQFRSKILYLIGRTNRILSELKIQHRTVDLSDQTNISISLPVSKWSPLILEIIRAQQILEAETKGSKSTKSQIKNSQGTLAAQSYLLQSDNNDNNMEPGDLNAQSDIVGNIENSSLHLILEQENFKVNFPTKDQLAIPIHFL